MKSLQFDKLIPVNTFHQWLEPSLINLTAGTQSRVTSDRKAIERYREDMVEGRWNYEESPPVVFFDGSNYYPGDGHHRIKSAELAKVKIYCEIRQGTLIEAIRYSCSANQRPSLHRTNADKRRAVELMYQTLIKEFGSLDAIPQSKGGARKKHDWGIRRIAEHVGVGKSLVSDVRAQLELTVRIGQFQEGDRVEMICPKRCKPLNLIDTGDRGTVLGTNHKRGVYVKWDLHPPSYTSPDRLKAIDKSSKKASQPKAENQPLPNLTNTISTDPKASSIHRDGKKLTLDLSPLPSQFNSDKILKLSRDSNSHKLTSSGFCSLPSIDNPLLENTHNEIELPPENNSLSPQMSNLNNDRAITKALEQLLEIIEFSLTGTCLNFCASQSAVANALEKTQLRVISSNIDSDSNTNYPSNGSLRGIRENLPEADWMIFPHPYNQVSDLLPLAYDKAKKGLIVLLKLSYLEPSPERAEWLAEHPPTQLICLPRCSWEQEGDLENVPTAWFIWLKDRLIKIRQPFTFVTP